MSDFGDGREVVGVKQHRCSWCGQSISKGEKHYRYKGMWEGEWQDWRMHLECREYADKEGAIYEGFMPFEGERPVQQVLGEEPR